jgi:hypothetical protein
MVFPLAQVADCGGGSWRPLRAPGAVRRHHLVEQTLAQSAIGNPHPLGWPALADRLQDGAAGKHQIGPVGADAGIGGASLEIPGQEHVEHAVDILV